MLYRCFLLDNFSSYGGAIVNQGRLNLVSCLFSNNIAAYSGGAIYSASGRVRIWNSTMISNACGDGSGGAIDNAGDAELWLLNSRVQFNRAHIFQPDAVACGGIDNSSDHPAILVHTLVRDNLGFSSYVIPSKHPDLFGEFVRLGRR